jgi:antitoxin component of MazEF toxin-antitoxin module
MIEMSHEYEVKRKLQEQSGSYLVILPKMWVQSEGLKEGDLLSIKFNGSLKIEPVRPNESEVKG